MSQPAGGLGRGSAQRCCFSRTSSPEWQQETEAKERAEISNRGPGPGFLCSAGRVPLPRRCVAQI